MTVEFDPYRKWLGIPEEEGRPVNHYWLLGVRLFEPDADVISNAADRQMAYIRGFQTSLHSAVSQKLLNELSAARICLLDPAKKAAYDAQLRKAKAKQEAQGDMEALVLHLLRGAWRYVVVTRQRLWTQWRTLPAAYQALGKAVYGQRRYSDRLGSILAEVDCLTGEIQRVEQPADMPVVPPPPPTGESQPPPPPLTPAGTSFWEGVKQIPALLAQRCRVTRLQWQQKRRFERLGAEAFQIDGVVAGPSDLTAPIQEAKTALERLSTEQNRLQTVQPGQGVAPAWIAWAGLGLVGLFALLILRFRFF